MAGVYCTSWHSEYDHGQKFEAPGYSRTLFKNQHATGCAVRAQVLELPWTFVSCSDAFNDANECQICAGPEHVAHKDAIVIAIDGACRGNGTKWAQSSIGIFFHRENSLNQARRIADRRHGHSSQRAELFAAIEALMTARKIRDENPDRGTRTCELPAPGPRRKLRRVVLMADSRYVVDAMTDWIYKWRQNGYINVKGERVVNEDFFRRLEQEVDELNDVGVDVQFWRVPREQNGVADCLANAALEGMDEEEALDRYFD